MPTAPTTKTCAEHRRRAAVAVCSVCGRPQCAECLVHTPVGLKCRQCTRGVARARGRPQRREPRPAETPARRRWAVPTAAAGIVLIGLAAYGLLRSDVPEAVPDGDDSQVTVAAERAVQITGAGGAAIAGTLKIPDAAEHARVPGVLIIPGFGPTNRDGIVPPGGAPDRLYADISDMLGEVGIASFRYDKRGSGQSELPDDQPLSFDDMVGDADAGLKFLADRAEIDRERLAVVGHDEGGMVALRLAATDPRVSRLVLISTPGRPLVDVLADDFINQTAGGPDPAHGQAHAAQLHSVVATLLATGQVPPPEELPSGLRPLFLPGRVTYLQQLFSFDSVAEARRVDVPVLIVRGGRDPGVSNIDADRLVAALGPDAEVVVGPEAGHSLALPPKEADSGEADSGSASSDDMHSQEFHRAVPGIRRDEGLLQRIGAWLGTGLGSGATRAAGTQEVAVTATGMRFAPGELRLGAGNYTFRFTNEDTVPHELRLAAGGHHDAHLAGVTDVQPGETRSFTAHLRPGTYEMGCHLPGHFEAGMRGAITVEPGAVRSPQP